MYKHYIAIWTVDEELKRCNKNTIHTFKDGDGEKHFIASKLRRIDDETLNKIREILTEFKIKEKSCDMCKHFGGLGCPSFIRDKCHQHSEWERSDNE